MLATTEHGPLLDLLCAAKSSTECLAPGHLHIFVVAVEKWMHSEHNHILVELNCHLRESCSLLSMDEVQRYHVSKLDVSIKILSKNVVYF